MRRTIVDIHAHFFPEAYLKLLETEGDRCGMALRRDHPAGPIIVAGSVTFGPLSPGFYDPEIRLKAMDEQQVQVHALSLTAPMVYPAEGPLGLTLAQTWNDATVEIARAHPDRFVPLATLPLQEPAAAVAELDRAVTGLGCRGVYLGTNVRGKELSDPVFLPVFDRLDALGVPVFLHPVNVLGGDRLAPYYFHNLLGNPFDTALAAANLIFAGLLDRFPRLEVCLPHAGGALPYLIGRLDRGWEVRPECRHLSRPPSAYLKRFTYDTLGHGPAALRYLIGLVGADRVMLGSDYCFDMGYERPVGVITALKLSRSDQDQILGGTAMRLLRLG
ncbi:MAG: amidohydrolase [Deltaproteobacteria bacterium]|nr:amidohydrolase [Deltaproteobacteria bacterium]